MFGVLDWYCSSCKRRCEQQIERHHFLVFGDHRTILHNKAHRVPVPVQWIGHANLLWELHKQELAKFNDSRRAREKQHARSLANMKKEIEDERERVYAAVSDERDASVAQLRMAQEASRCQGALATSVVSVERSVRPPPCPSPRCLFLLSLRGLVETKTFGARSLHVSAPSHAGASRVGVFRC